MFPGHYHCPLYYAFFPSFFILFFMTIVSYISVFIKVRSNRHMHSNSAAGAREKN